MRLNFSEKFSRLSAISGIQVLFNTEWRPLRPWMHRTSRQSVAPAVPCDVRISSTRVHCPWGYRVNEDVLHSVQGLPVALSLQAETAAGRGPRCGDSFP